MIQILYVIVTMVASGVIIAQLMRKAGMDPSNTNGSQGDLPVVFGALFIGMLGGSGLYRAAQMPAVQPIAGALDGYAGVLLIAPTLIAITLVIKLFVIALRAAFRLV